MLEKLTVTNYALIRQLELELSPSLNIITGETGAGKSILLGALGLVLGNRSETSVLKDTEHNCVIEATFDLDGLGLEPFFEENDLDFDRHTTIRRVITPAGKSRAYVNDLPVQLTALKELSGRLIDIHSQNRSALVGDEAFRMEVIDRLADDEPLRAAYRTAYAALREREKRLQQLREEIERNRRDEAYLRHEWERLSALALRSGETEELEQEQRELSNAGEILATLGAIAERFDREEEGTLSGLRAAENGLLHIRDLLGGAAPLAERIDSVYVELKDIASEIATLAARIEDNPARLEAVDNRLGAIYDLRRRHGVETDDELIALEASFRQKLEAIADADSDLSELEAEIARLRAEAEEAAARLTEARRTAAGAFGTAVEQVLARLGMTAARFEAEIAPLGQLAPTGADAVRFLFDANGGEHVTLQPLEKVASGGETSRVMLALKSIVARSTQLPTIIFDEIDTGVSGRVAAITGDIIAELGRSMQVINITHLPQVASKGDTHFFVFKEATPEGNATRIRLLGREERIGEIAKMLSGDTVTPAAIAQARELLGYKE